MHIFQPLPSNGGPLSSQTSHRWSRWCRSTAASGHPGHALKPAESAIFQPGVQKKKKIYVASQEKKNDNQQQSEKNPPKL